MTTYTWDEARRLSNLRKHGLDFADAHAVFGAECYTAEDMRFHYGEQRFITIGHFAGREVAVIYTEHDDEIRLISFRKANRHERRTLFGR